MNRTFLFLVLAPFLITCQKAQRDEDVTTNSAEDLALAQVIFSDAYKQIRTAALHSKGISSTSDTIASIFGCEIIKVDTLSDPKIITIDYKYTGCVGMGKGRFGRLIASFFGDFQEESSAVDIEFSNYFYEEIEVQGKIRVIFKGINTNGRLYYTFYVQSGFLDDGRTNMSWVANQNWIEYENGSEATEFRVTGNCNGVNRKGNVFFGEIHAQNVLSEDCLYPMSGTCEIEVLNLSNRLLEYGNGICDSRIGVMINGAEYESRIP